MKQLDILHPPRAAGSPFDVSETLLEWPWDASAAARHVSAQ
jgi:hypothetical protein